MSRRFRWRSLRASVRGPRVGWAAVALRYWGIRAPVFRVFDAERYGRRGLVCVPGLNAPSCDSLFCQRWWVVLGKQIEVKTVGEADGFLALLRIVAGLGVFSNDARQKETARALEVGHEIVGGIA